MILSEDEARTKWCPWARVLTGDYETQKSYFVPAHNRVGFPEHKGQRPQAANCIGTNCMAWRKLGQDSNKKEMGCCGLAHPNP